MENEKKVKIKEAAKDLFLKKGYEFCTMEEIENEAGQTKGSGHMFFDSKAQLFSLVIESLSDNILDECGKIILNKKKDVLARLDEILTYLNENSLKLDNLLKGNQRNKQSLEDHKFAGFIKYQELAEAMSEYLYEGCQKGVFFAEQPKARAYYIVFGFMGLRNSNITEKEKYEELKDCLLKLLNINDISTNEKYKIA